MSSYSVLESELWLDPLSLRENFTWTFAGNVVYAGSQWGVLVALAKLGTPEMVGQFALGLAVCTPVFIFANLALRAVQVTDAKREYLFGDYLGLRLITTTLALCVIAGITIAAGYRWEMALVILVVGLARAFESISDVLYGLLQQHERMDRIGKSMIIKGPLSLIALGIGVYLTGSVLWGMVGLAVVRALILVGYDAHNGALILKASSQKSARVAPEEASPAVALQPRWEIEMLRKLAWLALPLGVTMMLGSLNTNIPRYFIERFFGERELGIFAAIASLVVAGTTVVNALGQSASPRLAKYYAAGNGAAFCTLLLKLVGIGALLGGAGVLVVLAAGREILILLYGPEYAEHGDVLLWLMVAGAVHYASSFLGRGMTAAHYFRIQPFISAVSVVITTSLCILLIPEHGISGAAWVVVIVGCVQTVGMLFCNAHAIHILSNCKDCYEREE